MGKAFGFHSSVLTGPRMVVGVGALQLDTASESPKAKQHLYAFSLPGRGGRPKVFMYENTDQGRAELANLIRSETVVSVVYGTAVEFENASVVGLTVDNHRLVHKTIFPGP